jgi:hypothetical protein
VEIVQHDKGNQKSELSHFPSEAETEYSSTQAVMCFNYFRIKSKLRKKEICIEYRLRKIIFVLRVFFSCSTLLQSDSVTHIKQFTCFLSTHKNSEEGNLNIDHLLVHCRPIVSLLSYLVSE